MLKLKDGFTGERSIVLPKIIIEMMEKDPLMSLLHITDIGYYPKAAHHYRERMEAINQYVIIYCIEGYGWFRVGENEYRIKPNQYFILPAGVPHTYAADELYPWTIYWAHFKGSAAPFYAQNAMHPMDICPEADSRISDRINLFEEIFNTLNAGYSNENLHYASALLHYYLGSLRYIQQFRKAKGTHLDEEDAIDIAVHYMKENIEKHLTLTEIADFIGYSVSHFSMLFKNKIGHSPLTYFNLLKIQKACQLLSNTDMKINQICYKIGIEDTYYFSRLFNKIMGMSPKKYRTLNIG